MLARGRSHVGSSRLCSAEESVDCSLERTLVVRVSVVCAWGVCDDVVRRAALEIEPRSREESRTWQILIDHLCPLGRTAVGDKE